MLRLLTLMIFRIIALISLIKLAAPPRLQHSFSLLTTARKPLNPQSHLNALLKKPCTAVRIVNAIESLIPLPRPPQSVIALVDNINARVAATSAAQYNSASAAVGVFLVTQSHYARAACTITAVTSYCCARSSATLSFASRTTSRQIRLSAQVRVYSKSLGHFPFALAPMARVVFVSTAESENCLHWVLTSDKLCNMYCALVTQRAGCCCVMAPSY